MRKENGCTEGSQGPWRLMKDQNNNLVTNACKKKDYTTDKSPGKDKVTTAYHTFNQQKVLEMGEKEGTVTIDIKLSTIWKERRVKTKVKLCNDKIKVPKS